MAIDLASIRMEVNQTKNKIGAVISFIISIIFLILSIISFVFSWKVGLAFFVISLLFFGLYKFAKFSNKHNQEVLEKLQGYKDQNPEEVI